MLRLVPVKRNGVERTFDEMFNMMDDFFKTPEKIIRKFKLDVVKNEEAYLVEAEIPGVKRENIEIDFDNDLLYIKVKSEEVNEEEKKHYIHRERHVEAMERVLRFEDVNFENIQAKLEDGILKIILPKMPLVENKKRIEIQ